ncbi:MAG: nicotinate-nucleotide adenylyltransferase [Planctomycetota bacterium]
MQCSHDRDDTSSAPKRCCYRSKPIPIFLILTEESTPIGRSVGILGGSFDPIHIGHLWIAEAAREQLNLDEVLWVPAATSPLKPAGPTASDNHRKAMIQLAIGGNASFSLDGRELRAGGISYSVDTVRSLRQEEPDTQWFFIMGSDSLASMESWNEPSEFLELVTPAIIQRGGDPPIDLSVLETLTRQDRIEQIERYIVKMPAIELSSTEIRKRLELGQSIRYRVPAAVETYIDFEKVYDIDA